MKRSILLVVILCLGLASAAFGQATSTTGGIDGHVLDPTGAAVPGAKVTVLGQSGVPTVVNTNGEGLFEVKNLNPGNYSVNVEMQGFKTAKVASVEVRETSFLFSGLMS